MAFDIIRDKVASNTRTVLTKARRSGSTPRQAAVLLAKERIAAAMTTRRWSLY